MLPYKGKVGETTLKSLRYNLKSVIYVTIATFTVIVTLFKHSDDVYWNVWTNI